MSKQHLIVQAGLAVAGLSFIAYPALRPYGPESGAGGAADFASDAWLVAHAFGMLGFVALALTLRRAAVTSPWPRNGRPLREVETRMWLAVALLLPYYGAEAYGLHELGRYATRTGDVGVLDVADKFRYAPLEVTTFALGLLLLVLVGGRIIHGLWSSSPVGRTGGLLAGLGLVTYLPQFFGPGEIRVAHGVLLGLGLLLMAASLSRADRSEPVSQLDVRAR